MKQKIYIPQPIAAAGEDYLIEKGYEIVRGSGKTDKESIKNDIAVCDAMMVMLISYFLISAQFQKI